MVHAVGIQIQRIPLLGIEADTDNSGKTSLLNVFTRSVRLFVFIHISALILTTEQRFLPNRVRADRV